MILYVLIIVYFTTYMFFVSHIELDLPDAILKETIRPRTRIGINIGGIDWLGERIDGNGHFRCW